jgi:TRAP-type mannitol/chloroaromatic compound transport system substrate-binding protein
VLRARLRHPFGLNSRQMTAWMYEGNGLKLMREFYAKYNIINFPGGNTGAQMGGWYRKEIKSLADLKGLKFRIGGFAGKVLERMGACPEHPGGESTRRSKREPSMRRVGRPVRRPEAGFTRSRRYYYYPGWWEGGPNWTSSSTRRPTRAVGREQGGSCESAAARRALVVQAATTPATPRAQEAGGAGTKLRPFPPT